MIYSEAKRAGTPHRRRPKLLAAITINIHHHNLIVLDILYLFLLRLLLHLCRYLQGVFIIHIFLVAAGLLGYLKVGGADQVLLEFALAEDLRALGAVAVVTIDAEARVGRHGDESCTEVLHLLVVVPVAATGTQKHVARLKPFKIFKVLRLKLKTGLRHLPNCLLPASILDYFLHRDTLRIIHIVQSAVGVPAQGVPVRAQEEVLFLCVICRYGLARLPLRLYPEPKSLSRPDHNVSFEAAEVRIVAAGNEYLPWHLGGKLPKDMHCGGGRKCLKCRLRRHHMLASHGLGTLDPLTLPCLQVRPLPQLLALQVYGCIK